MYLGHIVEVDYGTSGAGYVHQVEIGTLQWQSS
jgi:hypothetical protein